MLPYKPGNKYSDEDIQKLVLSLRGNRGSPKTAAEFKRRSRLKAHGLSYGDFEDRLKAQNWQCAICFREIRKKPNLDHNHKTGKVRGILCHGCNVGIGFLGDSIDTLLAAVEYLMQHEEL